MKSKDYEFVRAGVGFRIFRHRKTGRLGKFVAAQPGQQFITYKRRKWAFQSHDFVRNEAERNPASASLRRGKPVKGFGKKKRDLASYQREYDILSGTNTFAKDEYKKKRIPQIQKHIQRLTKNPSHSKRTAWIIRGYGRHQAGSKHFDARGYTYFDGYTGFKPTSRQAMRYPSKIMAIGKAKSIQNSLPFQVEGIEVIQSSLRGTF